MPGKKITVKQHVVKSVDGKAKVRKAHVRDVTPGEVKRTSKVPQMKSLKTASPKPSVKNTPRSVSEYETFDKRQAQRLLEVESNSEQIFDEQNAERCGICAQRVGTNHESNSVHRHCLNCSDCYAAAQSMISAQNFSTRSKCTNVIFSKAIRRSGSANFYDAERLMMEIITAQTSTEQRRKVREFYNLPEENKPKNFKGLTLEGTENFFQKSCSQIRSAYPGKLLTSKNNRNGKDVFVEETQTWLEFKSSFEKTDANSGLEIVAYVSCLDKEKLSQALSPKERRVMRDENEIEKSKQKAMEDLRELFKNIPPRGRQGLFNYALAVSYGYTQKDDIKNFITHLRKNNSLEGLNIPKKMVFQPDGSLFSYTDYFIPGEKFTFDVVAGDEGRPFFKICGKESGMAAIIYPNYKNSWTDSETGEKLPAKNWVSSPCFHVWVKPQNVLEGDFLKEIEKDTR